jgi:hypothetical protein
MKRGQHLCANRRSALRLLVDKEFRRLMERNVCRRNAA